MQIFTTQKNHLNLGHVRISLASIYITATQFKLSDEGIKIQYYYFIDQKALFLEFVEMSAMFSVGPSKRCNLYSTQCDHWVKSIFIAKKFVDVRI